MDQHDDPALGLARRGLLQGMGLAAAVAALGGGTAVGAEPIAPADGTIRLAGRAVRFVDMTHKLTKAFNFGQTRPPRIDFEAIDGSGKAAGMKLNRLALVEHTGTHIDAPSHFGEGGRSLGEIPIADLIVPLAVLDVRQKRAADGNARVEASDIEQWERRHGRLPSGCCVAMWSGFDPVGADFPRPVPGMRRPVMPGFSPEIVDLMTRRRAVKGVAVDTMNIDTGENVPAYPFHQQWLATGGWGIEGMANLFAVPAKGAVLIVGAPPVEGATGMPIRAIALF